MRVPTTKPAWTAIVIQAVSTDVRPNSRAICAFAAVAENHNVIPRNIASDSQPS